MENGTEKEKCKRFIIAWDIYNSDKLIIYRELDWNRDTIRYE